MTGHSVRAGLCLGLIALSIGCGRRDAREGWDPAAVRAVARAAAAGDDIAVLETAGPTGGEQLSWGVRQSLTTGGFRLVESTDLPVPGLLVLVFESSRRDGDDWIVHTHMLQQDSARPSTAWRVRCQEDLCQAAPIDG